MKPVSYRQWGSVVFLMLACIFLAYQRLHKPRILVVHSYHPQMPWVQSLNTGIRSIFANKAYISVRYFYMDAKHKNSKRYMRRIEHSIENSIRAYKPEVIIAFDPDAQTVIANLLRKGLTRRVIFAGITSERRLGLFTKLPNVTGITEKIPIIAIREILSLIFRERRKIYYLSDDSKAARHLDKDISQQNWGSYQIVRHKRVTTLKAWKEAIIEAQQQADIILVSVYHSLRDKKRWVDKKELVRWTNTHSQLPVVGLYESFVIDGGLLSIAISSLEQGLAAAKIAFQLVENKKDIATFPLQQGKTFSLFINKKQLQQRFSDAHIPMILDAFSHTHSMPVFSNALN